MLTGFPNEVDNFKIFYSVGMFVKKGKIPSQALSLIKHFGEETRNLVRDDKVMASVVGNKKRVVIVE
jgi:hypothetical protein